MSPPANQSPASHPSTHRSGPCPDLPAKQRGRDVGSSGGATIRAPQALPDRDSAAAALDARGSAPLPRPTIRLVPGRQLLTARAVADLLDVCPETVLRWIRNGELPAIRLPGGAIRIVDTELHDWLQARATPARGVLATTTGAADNRRYRQEYYGCC